MSRSFCRQAQDFSYGVHTTSSLEFLPILLCYLWTLSSLSFTVCICRGTLVSAVPPHPPCSELHPYHKHHLHTTPHILPCRTTLHTPSSQSYIPPYSSPPSAPSPPLYSEDMYAQDSIDMLVQAGIQFTRHEQDGISPQDFAELLMMSGLVLTPKVSWIAFHRWVGLRAVGGPCGVVCRRPLSTMCQVQL